jgi:hypothetical protein
MSKLWHRKFCNDTHGVISEKKLILMDIYFICIYTIYYSEHFIVTNTTNFPQQDMKRTSVSRESKCGAAKLRCLWVSNPTVKR